MSRLGHPQQLPDETKAVCLWWYSLNIRDNAHLETALTAIGKESHEGRALREPGVYAFEGAHDSRPTGGLLYIGQVGADCEETKDKPGRTIKERACESFSRFAWTGTSKRAGVAETGLFADVWNLKLRWANVERDSIKAVERLLILAHAPS